MVNFSKLCCLPRRVDSHHIQNVRPQTLAAYEKALAGLVDFLLRENLNPESSGELDCLIVQYKNSRMLTRSQLNYTIAAVEFFLPQVKRELQWSRRVADGQLAVHATKHTTPMTSAIARLYGASFSTAGKTRMGIGIQVQQCLGLRPSELLRLHKEHVLPPCFGGGKFILRLGALVSTKAKRE